jgi:hypothetical protein
MLAFSPLAAAGCAYGAPAQQPQVQQIGQTLLNAYETSTAAPGVMAEVSQTVQSGIDPVAQAKGSYVFWFKRQIGQASLTIQDAEGSTSLVAVRAGASFYRAPNQNKLAENRIDLTNVGQRTPDNLPEILSPGMDPFQLTTLLGALQWPDSIQSLGPVAVADSTGKHIEYQITVDTDNLARHESGADKEWLQAMAREPRGKFVTLEITLDNGQIGTASASLPLPPVPLPAVPKEKRPTSPSLQTPPPGSVVITADFEYGKQVPVLKKPLPRKGELRGMSLLDRRAGWLVGVITIGLWAGARSLSCLLDPMGAR